MIRKIVILVLILVVLIVPAALADAGGAPRPIDGKMIDIEIKALSDEISIGETATLELTITNLTQYNVTPSRMHFDIFWFQIGNHGHLLNIDMDELKLGAYESITFEITDEVDTNIDWYKVGDEYYVDVEAEIDYRVYGDDMREYYYQRAEKAITLKINNLYDGSDLIEIEWLDDKDTAYCYEYYYDDYYDDGGTALRTVTEVFYEMNLKNYSDVVVAKVQPYTEAIVHEYFRFWHSLEDEVDDTHTFRFDPIFYMNGKHYCIEEARIYDVEFLQMPNVSVTVEKIESDDSYLTKKYNITVKNTGDTAIQDFMVSTRNDHKDYNGLDYRKLADLQPGETTSFECYYQENETIGDISIGYFRDGMFIYWLMYCRTEKSSTGERTVEVEYDYYAGIFDYEYYNRIEEQGESIPILLAATPTPTTPDITATPTPIPTAQVVVVKRQTPMLWALIAVLALSIGAAVMITIAIAKKGKEKGEGEKK